MGKKKPPCVSISLSNYIYKKEKKKRLETRVIGFSWQGDRTVRRQRSARVNVCVTSKGFRARFCSPETPRSPSVGQGSMSGAPGSWQPLALTPPCVYLEQMARERRQGQCRRTAQVRPENPRKGEQKTPDLGAMLCYQVWKRCLANQPSSGPDSLADTLFLFLFPFLFPFCICNFCNFVILITKV